LRGGGGPSKNTVGKGGKTQSKTRKKPLAVGTAGGTKPKTDKGG